MFKFFCVSIVSFLLSISSLQALTIKSGETIQSKSKEDKANSSVIGGPIPGKDMCRNTKVEENEFTFFSTAERPGCASSDKKPYKDEWLEFSHSNRSEWIIQMPKESGVWVFDADISYEGDFGDRNTVFQIHDGYGKCEGDCKHGSGKPPSWLGVTSGNSNIALFEQCFFFSDGYRPNGNKCNLPATKAFKLTVIIDLEEFDRGTVTYIVDNILLRKKDIKTRTGNPFEPHFGIYRINGQGDLTAKYKNVSFEKVDKVIASNIIGMTKPNS